MSVSLFVCLSIYLYVCKFTCLTDGRLSVSLYIPFYFLLSVCMLVRYFPSESVRVFIYMTVSLPVCFFIVFNGFSKYGICSNNGQLLIKERVKVIQFYNNYFRNKISSEIDYYVIFILYCFGYSTFSHFQIFKSFVKTYKFFFNPAIKSFIFIFKALY